MYPPPNGHAYRWDGAAQAHEASAGQEQCRWFVTSPLEDGVTNHLHSFKTRSRLRPRGNGLAWPDSLQEWQGERPPIPADHLVPIVIRCVVGAMVLGTGAYAVRTSTVAKW